MGQLSFTGTSLSGVNIIDSFKAEDNRGCLSKYYSQFEYENNGISFVPVEQAFIKNKKRILRGLHFQDIDPIPRIISCLEGIVSVSVVELNFESETIGGSMIKSINSGQSVYIPANCALGTLSLTDSIIHIMYGGRYIAKYSYGIRWDDTDLSIKWPLHLIDGTPVLSDKDRNLPTYYEYKTRRKKLCRKQ